MRREERDTQPCEDCVSRESVMSMIEPAYDSSGYLVDYVVSRKKIADLPSVTPARKTGKWKIVEVLHGEWEGTKRYACDKCGEKVGVFKSNYCPNCGARMEGGDEK